MIGEIWLFLRRQWRRVSLLILAGLLAPLVALQQGPIVPCSGLSCSLRDLLDIPVLIYNFLIGFAAMVLLVMIIWSGIRMMIFYVGDSPETELNDAKATLRRGLFGFVIVMGAYLIVNTLVYVILGLSASSGNPVFNLLQSLGL